MRRLFIGLAARLGRRSRFATRAIRGGLTAILLAVVMTIGLPSVAQASPSCGSYVKVTSSAYKGYASYCPMWRGWVPVFGKDSAGFVNPRAVVGYLVNGGRANWFICHWDAGPTYAAYGYTSVDYAKTVADNGQKGWVSAVYFAGAQNYWYGLDECPWGYYGWP